jgi:NhaP-type Na+/H+ or K+/H+ antiporter
MPGRRRDSRNVTLNEHPVLAIAAIGSVGAICQWIGWRLRVPAILFLLLAGVALGPIGGWLDPDLLFGQVLLPLVSLAVSVILFEGALTLRFTEIVGLETVIRRMVTSGVLLSWIVIAAAVRWLVDVSWELATLLGAILTVTGPTVVAPMLRTVRPTARIANILRWEGIVIDPLGALLAVLVFEFVVSAKGGSVVGQTLITFFTTIVAGGGIGLGAGYLIGEALRRDWIPEFLDNLLTLTSVFAVFAVSNALAQESGLLAVTVMGIFLANREGVPVEDILEFKESLSLLLISGVFIVLAARVDLAQLRSVGLAALLVLLAVQFVARPLKVIVAAWGTTLNWRERAMLSWIAPRGIVAAAVSSLFALRLGQLGVAQAELLVPLTFVVIIGTVVLQSVTAAPLARALRVSEPEPNGFLLIGANPLARAIGAALARQKVPVLLVDAHWDYVRSARQAGLRAFYGNPLSEHAELTLDLSGLGRLLALSTDAHLDALACSHYGREFGARKVYSLRMSADSDSLAPSASPGGNAFGDDATYADLAARLSRGAAIRTVALEERGGVAWFRERYGKHAVALFAVDPKGRIEVFAGGAEVEPGAGGSIIALVDPDVEESVPVAPPRPAAG